MIHIYPKWSLESHFGPSLAISKLGQKRRSSRIMENAIKFLRSLGIGVRPGSMPGISFLGRNFYTTHKTSSATLNVQRGLTGLVFTESLSFNSVLDVGAGNLSHSIYFAERGKRVTAVDFGKSVYFQDADNRPIKHSIEVIEDDFLNLPKGQTYDLVWASHVIEHQVNPGFFLQKCLSHVSEGGYLAITAPYPHENMWSGHVGFWTPGTLAYNIVLAGNSATSSASIDGHGEFFAIFKKKTIRLPEELAMDMGDLGILREHLPQAVSDGASCYATWNNLVP